jgi:predicted aspartyl protease
MAFIVVEHIFQGDRNLEDLFLWIIPVTVQFNDIRRTVNVLLDTGAQKTIFSQDLLEFLDLPRNQPSVRGSGVTGSSLYSVVSLDKLEIGSILFGDRDVLIGSLPKPYSKYYIDGILGGDILKELRVLIDYPQETLKIERSFISL